MHKPISMAFYQLHKLYFTMLAEYQHNRTENNIALTSQYMQQTPPAQEQNGLYHSKEECTRRVIKRLPTLLPE
jgi:hypothetical protein